MVVVGQQVDEDKEDMLEDCEEEEEVERSRLKLSSKTKKTTTIQMDVEEVGVNWNRGESKKQRK